MDRRLSSDKLDRGGVGASGRLARISPDKKSAAGQTKSHFNSNAASRDGGDSPKLWRRESKSTEPTGAPLLPDPAPAEPSPDSRFCMDGPFCFPGGDSASSSAVSLSFPELVQRIESTAGQAALLLNDRIESLHRRAQGAELPLSQIDETNAIADSVAAATYHCQMWAHALSGGEVRKPMKPEPCKDLDESFASMHFSMPWLMISAREVQGSLSKALSEHGAGAEARIRKRGVPADDLRSFSPHLEQIVHKLNRLLYELRPVTMADFVPAYFGPRLGKAPGKLILQYLGT